MIAIFTIEHGYVIGHFPRNNMPGSVYSFSSDFLPEPFFSRLKKKVYLLTEKQEQETSDIFRKLLRERDSGYVFSEALQRTYLLELFHLIMKVHIHYNERRHHPEN